MVDGASEHVLPAGRVRMEERDGLAFPAGCECPVDKHREEYDCKHEVALAVIGGPTALTGGPSHRIRLPWERDHDGSNSDDLPCFDCYEIPGMGPDSLWRWYVTRRTSGTFETAIWSMRSIETGSTKRRSSGG